jgi:hypothetical protein
MPILYPMTVGTASLNSPIIVYALCFACFKKRKKVLNNLIRKEINLMLYSPDTRWIQNHNIVQSPFDSEKLQY